MMNINEQRDIEILRYCFCCISPANNLALANMTIGGFYWISPTANLEPANVVIYSSTRFLPLVPSNMAINSFR